MLLMTIKLSTKIESSIALVVGVPEARYIHTRHMVKVSF